MALSRHSVGTYPEMNSNTTCQGTHTLIPLFMPGSVHSGSVAYACTNTADVHEQDKYKAYTGHKRFDSWNTHYYINNC